MNRADRARWASARTLADLGELTAQWIEGTIGEQPGYCGPSDLDDPDHLVPVLAAVNRAGYVTIQSQAGESGTAYDGRPYMHRAGVQGFAAQELALALNGAAWDAGLFPVVHAPSALPRWRTRHRDALTVVLWGGRARTAFGSQLSRRLIRDDWAGYGMCHRDAVDALCAAWQVTVIDPEWGRRDLLWDVLSSVASAGSQLTKKGRP